MEIEAAVTLVEKRVAMFLDQLSQDDLRWIVSSEQDVQGHVYRTIWDVCGELVRSRKAWIGIEAQPSWFFSEGDTEFSRSLGFGRWSANCKSL
jgi:hypothetical protein